MTSKMFDWKTQSNFTNVNGGEISEAIFQNFKKTVRHDEVKMKIRFWDLATFQFQTIHTMP